MPDAEIDIAAHRILLQETARAAGALALSMFRTKLRNWTKGASSPVSEADIAVNDLVERALRGAAPDYGWLSEESAEDATRTGKRLTWVVDPIDGTRAYIAGQQDWSVSIALVDHGQPILGVVFAPATDEFFFATRGGGASLNAVPIGAAPGVDIAVERIAGPKPLVERLTGPLGVRSLYPRIGSLALRLCRVAHGRIDIAFAGGRSRDWDLAAADLVVHESGGAMTTLDGDAIRYNTAAAAHDTLLAAGIDRHRAVVAAFAAGR